MNQSDAPCLTCGETRTRPAPKSCGDRDDHAATGRTWIVPLSFTRPPLSLNRTVHHMVLYRAKKEIADEVGWRARQIKLPKNLGRVRVLFHYAPVMGGAHDEDNISINVKPAIDALVRYGLVVDDSHEYVTSGARVEPCDKPGRCWISIEELVGGKN